MAERALHAGAALADVDTECGEIYQSDHVVQISGCLRDHRSAVGVPHQDNWPVGRPHIGTDRVRVEGKTAQQIGRRHHLVPGTFQLPNHPAEPGSVGERAMSTSPLSIDVYVSPMRPYNSPDPLGDGEEATWAPSSSTLIAGPTEGILIDALLTFSNADEIAAWAKSFGNKITGVYITHGHSDHWLGLAGLLEHFPERAATRLRKLLAAPRGKQNSTRPPGTGRRVSRASSPSRR
jgi:hypothetical protein